jgi:hypothetical protein
MQAVVYKHGRKWMRFCRADVEEIDVDDVMN